MNFKAFSVFDQKAECYMLPFFMGTKGQAIRSFQDCLKNQEHQFSKYPEDFTLYEIGEYDDSKALLSPHDKKISLGTALELKATTPTPLGAV